MTDYARSWCGVLMAAACFPACAFGLEYWTYSYQGIEVTADRTERAKTIAHNLHRLDLAITRVLDVSQVSAWRTPTVVYSVPTATFSRLRGKKDDTTSLFLSTPFENLIVIDAGEDRSDSSLFNPYFGYTGSVLVSAYTFRYPRWFIYGLSELFAASKMNGDTVTIGSVNAQRGQTLVQSRNPIPMRVLMAIQEGDPQLKDADFKNLYEAEAWLLVHLVVLEGKYRASFFHYFALRDQGEDEAKAFAASFNVTYEDLDKMLHDTLRTGKVETIKVSVADEKDAAEPARLTAAQAAGRLAQLASQIDPQIDDAEKMANEAVSIDPKNEDALYALARAQMRRADYAASFQAAERLCSLEALTQKSDSRCGILFYRFAEAARANKASLGADQANLLERSQQYFDKAITLDPNDFVAWDGMAKALTAIGNVQYAQAFLPRAAQALSKQVRNSDLSRSLANLCGATGDLRAALNYAVMWQASALSPESRDAASEYVSRLRASLASSDLKRAP